MGHGTCGAGSLGDLHCEVGAGDRFQGHRRETPPPRRIRGPSRRPPRRRPPRPHPTASAHGFIDLGNEFFQELGANGRRCVNCHVPTVGWTVTPASGCSRISRVLRMDSRSVGTALLSERGGSHRPRRVAAGRSRERQSLRAPSDHPGDLSGICTRTGRTTDRDGPFSVIAIDRSVIAIDWFRRSPSSEFRSWRAPRWRRWRSSTRSARWSRWAVATSSWRSTAGSPSWRRRTGRQDLGDMGSDVHESLSEALPLPAHGLAGDIGYP
jgi:hypothetical protein